MGTWDAEYRFKAFNSDLSLVYTIAIVTHEQFVLSISILSKMEPNT